MHSRFGLQHLDLDHPLKMENTTVGTVLLPHFFPDVGTFLFMIDISIQIHLVRTVHASVSSNIFVVTLRILLNRNDQT